MIFRDIDPELIGIRELVKYEHGYKVPLTQELWALIDDIDREIVSPYNWHALKDGNTFYAYTALPKKKKLSMHRLIMGIDNIDHIDKNGLNNHRLNMREATLSEQQANARLHSNSSSGINGVTLTQQGWMARVMKDGHRYFLGYFKDKIEAGKAVHTKSLELWPDRIHPDFDKWIKGEGWDDGSN